MIVSAFKSNIEDIRGAVKGGLLEILLGKI